MVGHEGGRDKADHGAGRDVDGDRVARVIGREQGGRDQRRRTAGDHRGELIAQRGTAVPQPRREGFGDQRGLGAVLHVVRDQRQHDRDEHRPGDRGVEHAEIEKPEDAHRHHADQIHLAPPDPVGDVAA